jgi:NAD+ synthase (glutamine-hydrolysing)
MTVLVVGAPFRHGSRIYNCDIVLHRGRVLRVVSKTYLPTYREFYDPSLRIGPGCGRQRNLDRFDACAIWHHLLFEADDVPGLECQPVTAASRFDHYLAELLTGLLQSRQGAKPGRR